MRIRSFAVYNFITVKMSFFGEHPPTEGLSTFDIELQEFYYKLLENIFNHHKMTTNVLKILKQDDIRNPKEASLKIPRLRSAFLFRYGPCYSSAIAHQLLRMINVNPFIFRDALWRRSLNVCCFGSVSIPAIVAICKIFTLAQDLFWESSRKPLHVSVTVVDKNRQWEWIAKYITRVLTKSDSMFNAVKMTLSVQHIKYNPAKLLNNPTVDVVKQADIVTMVKFISDIHYETVLQQVTWEVANCMKIDGVLFFLDTGIYQHCEIMKKVFKSSADMKCIYGPNDVEPFMLSLHSIRKCIELFWSVFKGNICLTSCIISSGAWIKTENADIKLNGKLTETHHKLARQIRMNKMMKARQERIEKANTSQMVLKAYHEKVFNVIPKKNKSNPKEESEDESEYNTVNYSKLNENILFKTKPKDKRLYLEVCVM